MSLIFREIEVADGSNLAQQDRVIVAAQNNVANASGAAGAAVTTAVSFPKGNLPGNYTVQINPGQACFAHVTQGSKTSTGFNVVLTPMDGSTAIAAGNFDVLVVG
jgi:hypothetical protein